MNCFEARQSLLTDPAHLPEAVAEHLAHCPRCGQMAASIRTLDVRVAEAFEMAVPVGMTDRIKFAGRRQRRSGWKPVVAGFAIAASVLAMVSVVWLPGGGDQEAVDWEHSMIAHMEHDPMHLLAADQNAATDFRQVVEHLGGQVAQIPPGLMRARICYLEGKKAVHAVFEEGGERLVVYLIPDITTRQTVVQMHGWEGDILSVAGSTVAVMSQGAGEAVDSLAESLGHSVQWS